MNERPEGEHQGDGGSKVGGGSCTYQPPHTPMHGQGGHPTIMPHFVDKPEPEREPNPIVDLVHSVASGIDEYEGLDAMIERVMSFGEYIHLKERRTTGVGTHYRGGQSS